MLSLACFILFAVGHPDGTLVFSSKPGTIVGNVAKRLTGGDQYTHVAVVVDGLVYESDWPRAKATPVASYGKPGTVNVFYEPIVPFSDLEVKRLRSSVVSRVGEPYRLRNYLRPNSRKTRGTWCSPFVLKALNDSGRYSLPGASGFEPQNLLEAVGGDYVLRFTVER